MDLINLGRSSHRRIVDARITRISGLSYKGFRERAREGERFVGSEG